MRPLDKFWASLTAAAALVLIVVVVVGFAAATPLTASSVHTDVQSTPAATALPAGQTHGAAAAAGSQNVSFNVTATKFTSTFSLNGYPYIEFPFNLTWTVTIINATLNYNNATDPIFQQQLNFTYIFSGCGPLGPGVQQPCLTYYTTAVPFSQHTTLTPTATGETGTFYYQLNPATLTNAAPSTIVNEGPETTVITPTGYEFNVSTGAPPGGPCGVPVPLVTGCKNPYTGITLPQGQWEISLWDYYNDTLGNSTTLETDQINYIAFSGPSGQVTNPSANFTSGSTTIAGNFSGYFVTGANITIYNSTDRTVFTAGVYSPGTGNHPYTAVWIASTPGAYKIVLTLSTTWLLNYQFNLTVSVLPPIPITYFNQTSGALIPGLSNGGSAALLVTLGAIIGMIVMAIVGRGLWGGTKPAPAQPWNPADTSKSTGTGSSDTSTGTSGGSSGGSSGSGGSSPPT